MRLVALLWLGVAGFGASTLGWTSRARAQERTAIDEAELDRRLRDAHRQATIWHWTWFGLFSGAALTQGVLASAVHEAREDRIASGLAALPPLVGISLLVATPIASLSLPSDLIAIQAAKGNDPSGRLGEKLRLLDRYADSESKQRNWFAHLGPVLLHASMAAIVLFVLDKPVDAAVQLGAGVVTNEIKILSAPRAATRAKAKADAARATSLRWLPLVSAAFVGVAASW